jgi:hypothetical protein
MAGVTTDEDVIEDLENEDGGENDKGQACAWP